jgi:Zn-dependent protease
MEMAYLGVECRLLRNRGLATKTDFDRLRESGMNFEYRSFRIQITSGVLFILAISWIVGAEKFGLRLGAVAGGLLLVSLLFHELGHIGVALVTSTPVTCMGAGFKGFYIGRRVASSFGREISIVSAGLVVQFIITLSCWSTPGIPHWLALMNAYLGAFNLLPVPGSDGRRLMKLVYERFSTKQPAMVPGT